MHITVKVVANWQHYHITVKYNHCHTYVHIIISVLSLPLLPQCCHCPCCYITSSTITVTMLCSFLLPQHCAQFCSHSTVHICVKPLWDSCCVVEVNLEVVGSGLGWYRKKYLCCDKVSSDRLCWGEVVYFEIGEVTYQVKRKRLGLQLWLS